MSGVSRHTYISIYLISNSSCADLTSLESLLESVKLTQGNPVLANAYKGTFQKYVNGWIAQNMMSEEDSAAFLDRTDLTGGIELTAAGLELASLCLAHEVCRASPKHMLCLNVQIDPEIICQTWNHSTRSSGNV